MVLILAVTVGRKGVNKMSEKWTEAGCQVGYAVKRGGESSAKTCGVRAITE